MKQDLRKIAGPYGSYISAASSEEFDAAFKVVATNLGGGGVVEVL